MEIQHGGVVSVKPGRMSREPEKETIEPAMQGQGGPDKIGYEVISQAGN